MEQKKEQANNLKGFEINKSFRIKGVLE